MSNANPTQARTIRVYNDLQALKSDANLQAGDIGETLAYHSWAEHPERFGRGAARYILRSGTNSEDGFLCHNTSQPGLQAHLMVDGSVDFLMAGALGLWDPMRKPEEQSYPIEYDQIGIERVLKSGLPVVERHNASYLITSTIEILCSDQKLVGVGPDCVIRLNKLIPNSGTRFVKAFNTGPGIRVGNIRSWCYLANFSVIAASILTSWADISWNEEDSGITLDGEKEPFLTNVHLQHIHVIGTNSGVKLSGVLDGRLEQLSIEHVRWGIRVAGCARNIQITVADCRVIGAGVAYQIAGSTNVLLTRCSADIIHHEMGPYESHSWNGAAILEGNNHDLEIRGFYVEDADRFYQGDPTLPSQVVLIDGFYYHNANTNTVFQSFVGEFGQLVAGVTLRNGLIIFLDNNDSGQPTPRGRIQAKKDNLIEGVRGGWLQLPALSDMKLVDTSSIYLRGNHFGEAVVIYKESKPT